MKPYLNQILLLWVLLACLSCKNKENITESQPAPENDTGDTSTYFSVTRDQFAMAKMALGSLKLYDFAEQVTANGHLNVPPENRVRIGTFMGGYVKSAELMPGTRVQKGQVLIVLENIEYLKLQQSYLEAREQLDYLKSVFESQKTLAEEKISAQRNFLQAKSDYHSMLAACESLAKQLQLLQIDPGAVKAETMVSSINLVSPIGGYITEVNAIQGMFVNPSDVLCEIIDPAHLHIELKVFEKDILKIRNGQTIIFRLPEASRESYTGEVILVGKAVEGNERTIAVHGHITGKPMLNLTTGMYVESVINTDSRQVEGLPADALVTEEGKHYVFVRDSERDDQYTFEKIPVKIGKVNEEWFEVVDSTGTLHKYADQILIKGSYYLTTDK